MKDFFGDSCKEDNNTSYTPVKRTLIYDPLLSRPYASLVVVVAGVGFFGNLAVVAVALRRKTLSRSSLLIAELAGSDLFFSITQLVMTVPLFWTNKWVYPGYMCKVLMSGQMLSGMYSIGFILLIAVVRYQGLIRTPSLVLSKGLIYGLTVANIGIGVLSVVPMFVVSDLDPELGKCWQYWPNEWIDSLIYQIYITVIYLVLPGFVIVILYSKVAYFLNKETKNNCAMRCSQMVFERRTAQNKKGARVVMSIFIAFVVCILPNRAVLVYFEAVDYKMSKTAFIVLSYIALIPYHFHLAANPIIYSILDPKWRTDIWNILTCREKLERGRCVSMAQSTPKTSISSTKSYGMRFNSVCKDDKGRNTSVDMGNSLLAFQQGVSLSFKDDVFLKQ